MGLLLPPPLGMEQPVLAMAMPPPSHARLPSKGWWQWQPLALWHTPSPSGIPLAPLATHGHAPLGGAKGHTPWRPMATPHLR